MALTVCDPLLLLNGLCNNRSHSSPAGLCSHGQLLYLCGQTCCVRVCLHMHVKFVQRHRVFCICPQRARLSVCGLAVHCDHSVARGASRGWTHPPWHRYGSMLGNPFICCHTRWPPSTTHIEEMGKKDKLQAAKRCQHRDAFLLLLKRFIDPVYTWY